MIIIKLRFFGAILCNLIFTIEFLIQETSESQPSKFSLRSNVCRDNKHTLEKIMKKKITGKAITKERVQ